MNSRRLVVISSGATTLVQIFDAITLSPALAQTPPRPPIRLDLGPGLEPTTPAMADGRLFVPIRSDSSSELRAYIASTGELRWRAALGSEDPSMSTPTIAGGVVYIAANSTHQVFAFSTDCAINGAACTPLARFGNQAWTGSSAIVADGRLYMTGYAGGIDALALPALGRSAL